MAYHCRQAAEYEDQVLWKKVKSHVKAIITGRLELLQLLGAVELA